MVPVLEAVPNFSAGRDTGLVERLARAASEAGADVQHVTADPDHNRAVLTYLGAPDVVEDASVAVARIAVEEIDLAKHRGVHPRIGALDVLPFIPLNGMSARDAREVARRVGVRLAEEVGLPVYFYAGASDPPGRGLAELRTGGFESLVAGTSPGREPDIVPTGWAHPGIHPSAGATCVGTREVLLAWNVDVEGLDNDTLARIASELRERDGGLEGLRVLGLTLEGQGRKQISMNLENARNRSPYQVFEAIEELVKAAGGRVQATEVVGLIPDELVFSAGADRLSLLDPDPSRALSSRLVDHLADRASGEAKALLATVGAYGEQVPDAVRRAAERLGRNLGASEFRKETR